MNDLADKIYIIRYKWWFYFTSIINNCIIRINKNSKFPIYVPERNIISVTSLKDKNYLPNEKEKYLREIGIEGEWYIYGIPRALGMDNAQEFRSKDLQRVCEEYGITISWRPVARPQFGGHIERMIGTAMNEIHTLPGSLFSSIQKRGEYNSEKKSIFTLKELEKWFANYIINQYHKHIHSAIRMTPEKKYELGIFGDDESPGRGLPEKISNEDYFKIAFSFNKIIFA